VNEVEELAAKQFGVEDGFHLELFFSSNDKWRKELRGPARNRVRTEAFQKTNVKDRVDLHCLGQIKAVRSCANLLENLKGTNSFVVELPGRAIGAQVSGIQPDLVTNLEIGLGHGLGIKVSGVTFNGRLNVELHFGIKIVE